MEDIRSKKHFDLKRVIVICRMCTGKLFYKNISNKDNEYVALGKSGHFALQDRLYQDFFAGKFWQFQSFIPYNLNTLHMYVFFFHFSLTFSHILSSLKTKCATTSGCSLLLQSCMKSNS